MANTTRAENSREQFVRTGSEGEVRGRRDEATRHDAARQETGRQPGQERERTIDTGRDLASTSSGRTAASQRVLGRISGLSQAGAAGSPFAMMSRMMDDMDRLFLDFGLGPALGASMGGGLVPGASTRTARDRGVATQRGQAGALGGGSWMPAMEVFTRGNELVARADLPGMKREDINVEVVEDHLVIQGERRSDRESREEGFFHSERSYGSFVRSIPLPEGTDGEGIQARFSDGVLEVTVPLPKQEERRKKVEIR